MITRGCILVEKGTLLPQAFRLENDSGPSAWPTMKSGLSSHDLESEFSATGWTFFYMAGVMKASAFGFDRQRSVQTAVNRLIASAKLQKCNCLEIDGVETHAFLGMPYVSVSAHSRHIQKGQLFSGR